MGREDRELQNAKKEYRDAEREGNHEEEARWANVIGDILKRKAEYVEALRWLRIDYELSVKYLPQKQLLPTCQSLGEVYLRLDRLKEALIYQKKHLELAKDSDDLIEQQRASTQLGRTYCELFRRSDNDHYAIRNAKKYLKLALKLSKTLKENPKSATSDKVLKEFIDSHNNVGMLELDLDNLQEAEKILLEGLRICDEEEMSQNDEVRSRLHHNLGSLYMELRNWGRSKEHTEKDIVICKNIGHKQGEAKGYINLGELHYRVQKYDEASLCYKKANEIASCLEDEDVLINHIRDNIKILEMAKEELEGLRGEEQRLKKLIRAVSDARGTRNERKRLIEVLGCLDGLIERAIAIFAWVKHKEYAKRKKKVASELCDKEKLSDSYLTIGESYMKLRNFTKAKKWYMKSWNVYRSIGNLEGQALCKINIGEILDSSGDWAGALQSFEEGYRIAAKGNLPVVQLSALENIHYSHMIRFDNLEEAKKVLKEISSLKQALKDENKPANSDHCSETESEGIVTSSPPNNNNINNNDDVMLDIDDNVPLSSLFKRRNEKSSFKCDNNVKEGLKSSQVSQKRKRVRVVISDDESDQSNHEVKRGGNSLQEEEEDKNYSNIASNNNNINNNNSNINNGNNILEGLNDMEVNSSDSTRIEESICSFKLKSPIKNILDDDVAPAQPSASKSVFSGSIGEKAQISSNIPHSALRSVFSGSNKSVASGNSKGENVQISSSIFQSQIGDGGFDPSGNEHCEFMAFKIGERMIYVDMNSCTQGGNLCIESLKAELASVYYLQVSEDRRSKGLLPVIKQLKCCGKDLDSFESIQDLKYFVAQQNCIEVLISGWVPKRLMKLYVDCCTKLSEAPSVKLLRKLYNLQVSEDEVIVSDCELQDLSFTPFLNALQAHKTIAVLDISHNSLGNDTIEKLQQIFTSSSQKYGGLTLDLHFNRFGPTALFQICECGVMSARLEVLNLSENRLTDACSSYLFTILQNCKALYSLNIEQCSITSRTIQKVADALNEESVLSHLSIGKNNPISGNSMSNLFSKLTTLKRFSELSLTGIRLNKIMLDQLCKFTSSSNLSALFLSSTSIGSDGAGSLIEQLSNGSQELLKLDISSCNITSDSFVKMSGNLSGLGGIFHLDLSGNSINREGSEALVRILKDSLLSLRTLILNKCNIGLAGLVHLIQSLSENDSLEELYVADNLSKDLDKTSQSTPTNPNPNLKPSPSGDNTTTCETNTHFINMEVPNSEDDEPTINNTNNKTTEINKINNLSNLSKSDGSCASSRQKTPNTPSHLIQELIDALLHANQLKMIDLSRNGFEKEVIDPLYSAWESSLRGGLARKHVNKDLVHFYLEGIKCCGVKSCCKRE